MLGGIIRKRRAALAAAALVACSAQCQVQSIERTQERFAPLPTIPFALPPALLIAPAPRAAVTPPHAQPAFLLRRDQPIHTELQAWAKANAWELLWHPPVSWRVFRDADLSETGEVTAAVGEVIAALRDEGKPLLLKISEGNRIMEVFVTREVQQ